MDRNSVALPVKLALIVAMSLGGSAAELPDRVPVDVQLYADQTTIRSGDIGDVLLEVRNALDVPIALPALRPHHRHLDIRTQDETGQRLAVAAMYIRQPRTFVILPPGAAIHLHLSVGEGLSIPWARESADLKLSVALDAPRDWIERLSGPEGFVDLVPLAGPAPHAQEVPPPSLPLDVFVVQGRFESNAIQIRWERGHGPQFPLGSAADVRRIREFLGSVSSRWTNRRMLRSLPPRLGRDNHSEPFENWARALLHRTVHVDVGEIGGLVQELEGSPIVDDAWFRFAVHPIWNGEESIRAELLANLIRRFPESTGARKARAYLQWPDGRLYLAAYSGW